MAQISIINRSRKKEGNIKLRFRLTDGRNIQLYHRSEISADLHDLQKFNPDGTPKKRANYNRELHQAISNRIHAINTVYADMVSRRVYITSDSFARELDKHLHPFGRSGRDLLTRFCDFIESSALSEGRKKGYRVMEGILRRYLTVTAQSSITPDEVNREFIDGLYSFISDETPFAESPRWCSLYSDMRVKPAPRAQNTVSAKLKIMRAFFEVLTEAEEIPRNPFVTLGKENRRTMLREAYGDPIPLTLEEVKMLLSVKVSTELEETRDAFLMLCALGCRVGEFSKLTAGNMRLTDEGVPYVAYIPEKTKEIKEIKTPLVKFAYDIAKNRKFRFSVCGNVNGRDGLNKRIKRLFKECGLNREVREYQESTESWIARPLSEVVSSKTGRKTFVTLAVLTSVNKDAGGLHAEGSKAINHYFADSIQERFKRLSVAFSEPLYTVSEEEFRETFND